MDGPLGCVMAQRCSRAVQWGSGVVVALLVVGCACAGTRKNDPVGVIHSEPAPETSQVVSDAGTEVSSTDDDVSDSELTSSGTASTNSDAACPPPPTVLETAWQDDLCRGRCGTCRDTQNGNGCAELEWCDGSCPSAFSARACCSGRICAGECDELGRCVCGAVVGGCSGSALSVCRLEPDSGAWACLPVLTQSPVK